MATEEIKDPYLAMREIGRLLGETHRLKNDIQETMKNNVYYIEWGESNDEIRNSWAVLDRHMSQAVDSMDKYLQALENARPENLEAAYDPSEAAK